MAALSRPVRVPPAALGLLVIAVVAVLVPLPVILRPGWPMNHEEYSFFERVEGFRRAYLGGQWYPVWSPFCHEGYGSPYPLYYHRLHTSVTALLALVIGTVWAVKVMAAVLLFVGGAGMRRLLRVTGSGEVMATTGAVLFMMAPYTLVDWYFRGAFAEFTAMMLLPWIYAELARFWTGQRHWVRLSAGVVLLFFSHTIITYFFFVSLAPFVLLSLIGAQRARTWSGFLKEWPFIVGGVLLAAVTVLPQVIVESRLAHYFSIKVLVTPDQLVDAHYQPFARYFADAMTVDDGWKGRLSLEINRYLCIALLIFCMLPGASPRWRSMLGRPLYVFFLVWSVACLLLQLPAFAPVFHVLPKADFIQFSWRLMAFITLGSVFLFISHAQAAWGGHIVDKILVAAGLSVTVLLTVIRFGTFPQTEVPMLKPEWVHSLITDLDGPGSQGEFMLDGFHGARPPKKPFIETLGCNPRRQDTSRFDRGVYEFVADTDKPCQVVIRQFQTPILNIELENARLITPTPSARIVVELEPGHSRVSIRPRSLWSLLVHGDR